MNWVSLPTLNAKCFKDDPKPLHKLQRWCRLKFLPARKIGGEWHVDMDRLDIRQVQEPKKEPPKQDAEDLLRRLVAQINQNG